MALHLVGTRAPATVRLSRPTPFEGRWDLTCEGSQFACRKGERPHPIEDCHDCPRFTDRTIDPVTRRAHIECHWNERDPVAARMTMASALTTVGPDTPAGRADEIARGADVRHLLVLDQGHVAGVICRCDLVDAAPDRPVGELACSEIFAIASNGTIGDAATAMRSLGIGILPVLSGELLVGVITRGDLRRCGVPEALLGAHHCCACGSHHGVREVREGAMIEFCLDCYERASDPPDETGTGD
jgi:predicted transcriptional regulator